MLFRSRYLDKVHYHPVRLDDSGIDWNARWNGIEPAFAMEARQRDAISTALQHFPHDAMVMLSDLDEIPNRQTVDIAQQTLQDIPGIVFEQAFHWYNFGLVDTSPWRGTVMTFNNLMQAFGVQSVRDSRPGLPSLPNGGWHLSYWGEPWQISTKIAHFAHQEYNTDAWKNHQRLVENIAQGKDLYDRDNQLAPVDESTIDPDLYEIFSKYDRRANTIKPFADTVPGWFEYDDFAFYAWLYQQIPHGGHLVEVGSWQGRSSSHMATMIANGNKPIRFDCVDHWEDIFGQTDLDGSPLECFIRNMAPVNGW